MLSQQDRAGLCQNYPTEAAHDARELLQFRMMSPPAMEFGFACNHNICLNSFRNLILSHKDAIQTDKESIELYVFTLLRLLTQGIFFPLAVQIKFS